MTSDKNTADPASPAFRAEGDTNNDDKKKRSIDDISDKEKSEKSEQPEPPSEADKEKLRRKYLLRRFWRTARGFWSHHRGDRLAWVLSLSLVVLILANLGAQYGINVWNRVIFDALEQRDATTVLYLSAIFFPLAGASVLFGVTNVWARMTTQRRWRAWVSDSVISRWLKNGRYYQLNLVSGDHQNPEGRLTDDLRVATAVGPDLVRWRKAAPDGCPRSAASSRHHRARRGDIRARSEGPGCADEAAIR